MKPAIAIVGGTGAEGSRLALRFAAAGFRVTIGSRAANRAVSKAAELAALLPTGDGSIHGSSNQTAVVRAHLVTLRTPFDAALGTLAEVRKSLAPDTVIIDATVPLHFESGTPSIISLQLVQLIEQASV